jgi:hypothetical protein
VRPAPAPAPDEPGARHGAWQAAHVELAALEPDGSVTFTPIEQPPSHERLMAVNGSPTAAPMPGLPPPAYAIAPDRFLVVDNDRYRLLLWDRSARKLTDLGHGRTEVVPGQGRIAVGLDERGEHTRYLEIDPHADALRVLWVPPDGVGHELVGVHEGAPLVATTSWSEGKRTRKLGFVRLLGDGRTQSFAHTVDPSLSPANGDAVRGQRLLLVGGPVQVGAADRPFAEPIAILELDKGRVRELGDATGAFSVSTAVPHPYVRVQWSDHAARMHPGFPVEGCTNEIDVRTEAITTTGCEG